jgi:hypothetical protein
MRRLRQSVISGGGKIIDPREMTDGDGEFGGDGQRIVGAAGVGDDNLIDDAGERGQAVINKTCLIADDEARGNAGFESGCQRPRAA